MNRALLGYTGFVGGNLRKQSHFEHFFNSKNIDKIKGNYDLVVCAAAPGEKWKANNNPSEDTLAICRLIKNLKKIEANSFVLISTVDVYTKPENVNENTKTNKSKLLPYGKNRLLLEKFVEKKFENHFIIRLPGLFGSGIKKNAIYDLIHNNILTYTHKDSVFQFYYLDNLWRDIQVVMRNKIEKMNMATEPIGISEVAEKCFNTVLVGVSKNSPAKYNVKTIHAAIFNQKVDYIYNKKEIIRQIKRFVSTTKDK